jgi:hypothetical protein
MKFLCVPCGAPMKLVETKSPERGSISLIYGCPECGHELAMLTNPYETQIVGSLGVRIGPAEETASGGGEPSKCPFSGIVQEMSALPAEPGRVPWTAEASRRLEGIPEFVRPMARTGIEKFARDRGYAEIDERVLDEARTFFGM